MKVRIFVTLKSGILDPQGETVRKALSSLGFVGIEDVRVGKMFQLEVSGGNDIEKKVDRMCKKLLANPVIEDYAYEVIK